MATRNAHEEVLAQIGSPLNEIELRWRSKQAFLESRGFMLRARYHSEWVPSWTTNKKNPQLCEDYYSLPVYINLTDATRISDGKLVLIKRLPTHGNEVSIARLFSDPAVVGDPRNHCVPILDFFIDDEDPEVSYLVMPFLRHTDDPPFALVNDVVDLVDQLLEGLVFMHELGVAHRDCAEKNIMMDASPLYTKPYHPVQLDFAPDMSALVHPAYSRFTSPKPVKYYFVDFGISSHFTAEQPRELVLGMDGLDRDVPELSSTIPYDAFKVDVFILGNFFNGIALKGYSNVTFLSPLVEAMTTADPNTRPDASMVLRQWQGIKDSLGLCQRGMPLRPIEQGNRTGLQSLWPYFRLLALLMKRGLVSVVRLVGLIRD